MCQEFLGEKNIPTIVGIFTTHWPRIGATQLGMLPATGPMVGPMVMKHPQRASNNLGGWLRFVSGWGSFFLGAALGPHVVGMSGDQVSSKCVNEHPNKEHRAVHKDMDCEEPGVGYLVWNHGHIRATVSHPAEEHTYWSIHLSYLFLICASVNGGTLNHLMLWTMAVYRETTSSGLDRHP